MSNPISSKPPIPFCEVKAPYGQANVSSYLSGLGYNLTPQQITQYDNAPQYGNLTAVYWLDEMTGAVAHDATGNGNDATIVGGTWVASGLQFAGAAGNGLLLPFALGTDFEVIALTRGDATGGSQLIYGGATFSASGAYLSANTATTNYGMNYYGNSTTAYSVGTGGSAPSPYLWRIVDMWQCSQDQTQTYNQSSTIFTASITLGPSNAGFAYSVNCSAGPVTITMPLATATVQNQGQMYFVKVDSTTNALSFGTQGSDTFSSTPPSLTQNGMGLAFRRNGASSAWISLPGAGGLLFDTGVSAVSSSGLASVTPSTGNFCFGNNATGSGLAINSFKGYLGWLIVYQSRGLFSSVSYPQRANFLSYLGANFLPSGVALNT